MATPDTASDLRAGVHSDAETPPATAPQPGASPAAAYRVPGNGWTMAAFFLSLAVIGLGFLVLSFGMFVIENAVVWVAGLIVMDAGLIAWVLIASYMMVAYLRVCFASRKRSGQ